MIAYQSASIFRAGVTVIRLACFTPRNIQPTKCKPLSGLALKLLAAGMASINRGF